MLIQKSVCVCFFSPHQSWTFWCFLLHRPSIMVLKCCSKSLRCTQGANLRVSNHFFYCPDTAEDKFPFDDNLWLNVFLFVQVRYSNTNSLQAFCSLSHKDSDPLRFDCHLQYRQKWYMLMCFQKFIASHTVRCFLESCCLWQGPFHTSVISPASAAMHDNGNYIILSGERSHQCSMVQCDFWKGASASLVCSVCVCFFCPYWLQWQCT